MEYTKTILKLQIKNEALKSKTTTFHNRAQLY